MDKTSKKWRIVYVAFFVDALFLLYAYLNNSNFLERWYYYLLASLVSGLGAGAIVWLASSFYNEPSRQKLDLAETEAEEVLPKKVNREIKRHYLLYILGSLIVLTLVGYFAISYAKDTKETKKQQDLMQQQIDSQKKQLEYTGKFTTTPTTTPTLTTTPTPTTTPSTTNTKPTETTKTTPVGKNLRQYLPQLYDKKAECEKVITDQQAIIDEATPGYNEVVRQIEQWYSEISTGSCPYNCGVDTICSRPCHSTEYDELYKQKKDEAFSVYEGKTGLARQIRNVASDFLIKITTAINTVESKDEAYWLTRSTTFLEQYINEILNNNTDF